MSISSRRDQHFDLAELLARKEELEADKRASINEAIKSIGDYLLEDSQGEYRLDAAFAYYVAGYYVRALRLIAKSDFAENINLAQRWLALFLSKRFKDIDAQAIQITTDVNYSDQRIEYEIRECGLSDDEAIERILTLRLAEAFLLFIEFAQHGNEENLNDSYLLLKKCSQFACQARETQWWWWIQSIQYVIREYAENCLWSQLQPMRVDAAQMVGNYIQANYQLNNPVLELWRTQVESLPWVNDSLRRSFCLSIPTSGGKTRVAELAILRFLIDYQDDPSAKCVYIAPLRALASDVEQTFRPIFSIVTPNSQIVSSFYEGQELDILEIDEFLDARILIVTPEKLDGMLRNDPNLRSQIKLVVADEGHMIGEGDATKNKIERGYKYRSLIERLICLLKTKTNTADQKNARLLLVSGVLPNADEFAELIAGDRTNLVKLDWRPVEAPEIGTWTWDGANVSSSNLASAPMPLAMNGCASPNEFEAILVRTALASAFNGHTMVFSASKKAITSQAFLDLLFCLLVNNSLGKQPLSNTFHRRAGFEKYYAILERGAAVHHADLPFELKRETENRILDGRVRLLFATSTLAQGVNLKFDTAIIFRLRHFHEVPISEATFWNVVGRIGRPVNANSQELQSLHPPRVYFFINNSSNRSFEDNEDARLSKSLLAQQSKYRIASPFLEFLNKVRILWQQVSGKPIAELVESLAEKTDLQWLSVSRGKASPKQSQSVLITCDEASALLRHLDEHLMALMEEDNVGSDANEWLQKRLSEVLDLMTGVTTIKPEDVESIKELVRARAMFVANKIPYRQRKQDYLLGLPRNDCEEIRKNQDQLLVWYQGCEDIFARRFDSGLSRLSALLSFVSKLKICQEKPELSVWEKESCNNTLSLLESEDAIHRELLFLSWVRGDHTHEVAEAFSKLNPQADFDEFRIAMFEDRLTRGISAIGRFVNLIVEERGLRLSPDLRFLPSLVRYGVPSKLACWFVRQQINREDATKLAESCVGKMASDEEPMSPEVSISGYARFALGLLTNDEIENLALRDSSVVILQKLRMK